MNYDFSVISGIYNITVYIIIISLNYSADNYIRSNFQLNDYDMLIV